MNNQQEIQDALERLRRAFEKDGKKLLAIRCMAEYIEGHNPLMESCGMPSFSQN